MNKMKKKKRHDRIVRVFNIRRNNIKKSNQYEFSLKNGI